MGILGWIVVGLVAGTIAKMIMKDGNGGWVMTIILGIVGALVGGFLIGALFHIDFVRGFFDLSTWIAAIVGSCLVIWLYRLVTRGAGRRV